MRLFISIVACGLVFFLTSAGCHLLGGGTPTAQPMTGRDAAEIVGGTCYGDGTDNCPADNTGCKSACDNKVAGKACAGSSYLQANPTLEKVKGDPTGVSKSKPASAATLCGWDATCGPTCVSVTGGVSCPSTTAADYKLGTVPDADSGKCQREVSNDRPVAPGERAILFAINGGMLRAFH